MATLTKIKFNNPINVSLQIGDAIYVSTVSSNGIINTPAFAEKVLEIGSDYIKIDKGNTISPVINEGDFILFAKDIKANESSLKGYYADVTLENSSRKKTELFAVSSEVVPSSK